MSVGARERRFETEWRLTFLWALLSLSHQERDCGSAFLFVRAFDQGNHGTGDHDRHTEAWAIRGG